MTLDREMLDIGQGKFLTAGVLNDGRIFSLGKKLEILDVLKPLASKAAVPTAEITDFENRLKELAERKANLEQSLAAVHERKDAAMNAAEEAEVKLHTDNLEQEGVQVKSLGERIKFFEKQESSYAPLAENDEVFSGTLHSIREKIKDLKKQIGKQASLGNKKLASSTVILPKAGPHQLELLSQTVTYGEAKAFLNKPLV